MGWIKPWCKTGIRVSVPYPQARLYYTHTPTPLWPPPKKPRARLGGWGRMTTQAQPFIAMKGIPRQGSLGLANWGLFSLVSAEVGEQGTLETSWKADTL